MIDNSCCYPFVGYLDVYIDVPEMIDISYMRSKGLQPGEELLPEAGMCYCIAFRFLVDLVTLYFIVSWIKFHNFTEVFLTYLLLCVHKLKQNLLNANNSDYEVWITRKKVYIIIVILLILISSSVT